MYKFLIFFPLLTILGCATKDHESQNFDEIQISYSDGWHSSLSMKIISKSHIFVRNNISGEGTFGKLDNFQKATLDSFLSRVDILALDSVYKPVGYSISDCSSFRLYVRKTTVRKTIFSDCMAPEQLKASQIWLVQLSQTFVTSLDSTVDFHETDEGYK